MTYKSEIISPYAVLDDMLLLLTIAKKISPEKQTKLRDFLRGVNYGLDMAGVLSENSQASA